MTFDINTMLNPAVYDHKVASLKLVETHISWVVLTGKFAYKIKKPVNFGFLDFSSLEKRHQYCQQELRLNSRLAASIYLDVVGIVGSVDKPRIAKTGDAFEYAIKMKEFPQSAQLDQMLAAGELNLTHINAFADKVAAFHQSIPVAANSTEYGNKDSVYKPVVENFQHIVENLPTDCFADVLKSLQQWSEAEFVKLAVVFEHRKKNGFIRECHGDMHLRNLVWLNNKPVVFDCIEFNPAFRWIDVISDIAFLIMDLQDRKQTAFANRFLNSYLEVTGDYKGLSVIVFYLCYRAMVRAKVDALRLHQELEQKEIPTEEKDNLFSECKSYLDLAMTYTQQKTPRLIIMHGLSASGKSTVSQMLVDTTGSIRIRSDVERKRLFNLSPTDTAAAKMNAGLYSSQASEQTYNKLIELAEEILQAGFNVIVDAAFLKYAQRELFYTLAKKLNVAFKIINVIAPSAILRQRIIERSGDVSDADITVLEHQLVNKQALQENEMACVVTVDSTELVNIHAVVEEVF